MAQPQTQNVPEIYKRFSMILFDLSEIRNFPVYTKCLLFAHHLLGEKEGDLGEGDIEGQND